MQVLLPLTLLIVFNSFLIHSVRQSQKVRQVMTHRQTIVRSDREERAASNEIRITITLIAVVIMFLVCQLPTAATLIYNIFHDPSPQSNEEAVLRKSAHHARVLFADAILEQQARVELIDLSLDLHRRALTLGALHGQPFQPIALFVELLV